MAGERVAVRLRNGRQAAGEKAADDVRSGRHAACTVGDAQCARCSCRCQCVSAATDSALHGCQMVRYSSHYKGAAAATDSAPRALQNNIQ